ncbi:MAG: alcohol dehydrogenase catalytic domain-containing protein [Rhodospirillaceae bacterium]|jgi:2-desacetyl-2-hydroxyethyl bacteriochlorophyllide A dehydrogenase|nr:alcohol dehydrogenase catalytic domain-containing protein [Rhodospirillaceae bacterium]MBT4588661.1 alcohol dehydrogenase catalytic domain-containing protein [Rhodospirillaceae bacterium]MBT4940908.1 alcohol dehydrogenase catalytic domain-containing protein [Rhodospirillaceae bacterium]MBT7265386.1 alcohol dehydrogenase catalytic domain-containing protein [Rhodospirillaceae bacterium]
MKAALLTEPSKISISDMPMPVCGDGQVLVKISHVGICGTDTKIFDGGIPSNMPLVMGHEAVGEIVEGQAEDGSSPGDPVIIDPVLHCGNCFYCDKGDTHLCENGGLVGREVDGVFAEYFLAPAGNVFALGTKIDRAAAPLIQVMTTVLHAQNRAKIQTGEVVVVLGLGVTGLLQIQVAKALGAKVVIGVSRNAYKRGLADKMGADVTAEHGEDAKQKVLELTEGRGADVVIEAVGYISVLAEAMDIARIGGRIIPFGIYAALEGKLPFYQFYFKELNIINARAALPSDFPACIKLVEEGKVDLGPFITHTYSLDELSEAIKHLMAPSDERLKVILEV